MPRSNPDYAAIEVMNTMLGGLFSSRINMNLREKNGYTYGAFSVFLYKRGPGPFFAGSGIRTNVTAPAIKEIFHEIEEIRSTELTSAELTLAKDSVSRSLPGLFETLPRSARAIADLFLYNLPADYYGQLPGKIDAVTAADVQKAAQKYLTPESMIVVAVGDSSKIEPEIRKLNLGPIEVVDLEGNATK